MAEKNVNETDNTDLRRHAEEQLGERSSAHLIGTEEDPRLLHELQVHQIELEMQNAELLHARDEVEIVLEEYTGLYDFAPVGYFTLDRTGTIRKVNLTGSGLLGSERSRLIGRRFEQVVAAADRPAFTVFLDATFTNRDRKKFEVSLLKEGDSPQFVQIEGLAAASGEECRIAVIDITERRELEKKLEILHSDLTARAKELEAANIELEAFNYSVTHDLRTPLTVINSYCQVILGLGEGKLDGKCQGYIREMFEGTLRMDRLINTLLDFSGVTRVAMLHEKVDLSRIAGEVSRELKVSSPERRVSFRIDSGITAEGDAGLLRVVLNNLIGNAWKYVGSREGAIIEFGKTEVEGKPACFVRDNGPGFDMAFADKLFIPFHRIPGTDVAGHGIGLATVERIVRRHGGRVWAESKPGEGAIFYFTIA